MILTARAVTFYGSWPIATSAEEMAASELAQSIAECVRGKGAMAVTDKRIRDVDVRSVASECVTRYGLEAELHEQGDKLIAALALNNPYQMFCNSLAM